MPFVRKLVRRIRALVARRRLDHDLDAELAHHLELETERLVHTGLGPDEARRRARLAFGPVERFREETRDARGLRPLDDLVRDLRHGVRTLRRLPGFTAAVLITLGIGVGGSAAIYGAVDGILLTPLPYAEPDRIITLWEARTGESGEPAEVAPATFLDLRDRSRVFESLTAMEPYGLDWQSPTGPVYLSTWLVYEKFFEVLGRQPILGRTPRPDEHAPGRGNVVVLSHGVWRSRFAGDSTVIGRVISLDAQPFTVIGVMPQGFAIPDDDVVWAPKVLAGWEREARTTNFYTVLGRLADGATLEAARAELDVIAGALAAENPESSAGLAIRAVPLPERLLGRARTALLLLLGAVGLVLAIVLANVASLQLARAASRERELALRGALGAGQSRVARQLLAENLVLAALGAGLGFAVARVALPALRRLAPPDLPRLTELAADAEVWWFATLVSAVVTLSTGMLPALLAFRGGGAPALADGQRSMTHSRSVARAQSGLVVAQIALTLVLVIGAGLLTRSVRALLKEDRGFRTDGVVAVTVQSWSYYPRPADRVQFVHDVIEHLSNLPGVHAAGVASTVPLMQGIGAEQATLVIEGAPPRAPGETQPQVSFAAVTPGTFAALGIPLRRGRGIEPGDRGNGPPVAVVNEALARRYFGGGDAIGKRIRLVRSRQGSPPPPLEIVGTVGDVRRTALHEAGVPAAYVPHAQWPTGANAFVAWGAGDPTRLIEQVKRTIWRVNPTIPVYLETSMAQLVGRSVQDRTFLLAVLAGFAGLALALAAAGIFGLMSWLTAERTREIGVRMAFGARRGQVAGLVLRRAVRLTGAGVLLGAAGALAGTRWLAAMLYGVGPFDAMTFAAAVTALLATALVASWYPARRAAATDPMDALRDG